MVTNQSSTNQSQRPQFYENEYLGAGDLTAIVEYSRVQQERHALGAHTWGIAMGLQLKEKAQPGGTGQVDMYIQPGYAWDGFGRPIVVLAPYKIPAGLFSSIPYNAGTPGGQLVAIWLRYNEIEAQGPRPGFEVCDPADQFARVQESFQIEVGERRYLSDQRDPIIIAGRSVDASLAFQTFDSNDPPIPDASVPYQTFPDDNPNALWLIPLGLVRWKPNSNPNQPGNFVQRTTPDDLTQSRRVRQYIGVVAEGVQAADGIIRMRNRTTDDSTLAWSDDLVWVEGDLRVNGDAKLFGGKLDFRDSTGQNNDIPLTIQRNSFIAPIQPGGGAPQTVTELQVVIGQSNDANNRFAVGPIQKGVSPAPDVFQEKFIVRADGKVGIGTTTPRNPLGIRGTGSAEELISFEDPSGTTKWHINQHFNGNSGLNFVETGVADGRLFIQAGGNVGIGTTTPTNPLHVNGNTGVRQNRLYLSGGDGWSSLTYNAYHDASNGTWVFPDSSRTAVTIEMDDSRGAAPRFEVWSTTSGAKTNWIQRLAINGDSGNVLMAHNGGSVGIGTTTMSRKLHVEGDEIHSGAARAGFSFGNRETAGFVEIPSAGERWVWYSSSGTARLWSGNDKLSVTPVGSLDMAGNITVRGNRTYLLGLDGAQTHWIMAGGTQEGVNNAIGLTIGAFINTFHTGPGWAKGFLIHHPLHKEEKYLSHATLEGPEAAVFYRGEAELSDGIATVILPDYFEALTRKERRTVLLTSKLEGDKPVSTVAASEVTDGKFTVRAVDSENQTQKFYWEVKAVRADVGILSVEQMKVPMK